MKKYRLLAIAIPGLILLAGTITFIQGIRNDSRSRYERFLASEYRKHSQVNKPDALKSGEEKEMDSPDLAAFSEYIKTMDPELRTVPRERIVKANLATDASMRLKSTQSLTWTHFPTNMGGRTRTLMFDPNDPTRSKLWAGSVTGGLWYNNDPTGGGVWTPLNDFWSNLSISCMAYDPNNPQTFYVGTGESQTALIIYRESSGRGTGIMKSTDGGQSWAPMPGTENWAYITDILVRNENGTSVIYAAVVSGVYKGIPHRNQSGDGLYRSTNGGQTWTQVLPNIPGTQIAYSPSDIDMSADGTTLFVGTTYGVNSEASDNDRSGAACILTSADGLTWTVNSTYQQEILAETTNKYPGRVMLTRVPSDPNMMYAIIASGYVRSDQFIGYGCHALVKTSNKGVSWSKVNFPAGFASLAWHAFVVGVSPVNPNIIWLGGLDTYRTVNGGTTWTKLSNWAEMYGTGSDSYVHADIHAFTFRPGSDSELFIGTDGGVFGTRTASAPDANMKFFESANGYSTLQYYSCAMHPDAGAVHFIGGLQDNGTMFYRKDRTPTFRDMLSGGDGALCFIDQNEPSIQITTVYHNAIYLYSGNKEADPQSAGYRGLGTGMFVNAMDYDWKRNILYANGANEQRQYLNTLHVMTVTANSISSGSPAKNLQTSSQVPYSNIKWSPFSPAGQSNIFIGTEAGKIFKLANASITASTLTNLTPTEFPAANISSIDLVGSEDTLLVTFSNYGVPSVWISVNGGQTWKNVEANLPDMPVRWGIFHPRSSKQVMLATESGIWTTDNVFAQNVIWTADNQGLANVRIDMLKFRDSDNTVLAATHGRGMFTTVWEPNFINGVEGVEKIEMVEVFPNPTDGWVEIRVPASGKVRIVVQDIQGRTLVAEEVQSTTALLTKKIDLTRQPAGTYVIRVTAGQKTSVNQILKN